jgi:integration host factor subunit beta
MAFERGFLTNPEKLNYSSEYMNRSDLIQLLADRFSQLTQKDAEASVSTILDTMNRALARGHRIEIRGFGSFTVIQRAPRLGRNPRSGGAVDVPERRQAHFKVGKALREAVNVPAVDVTHSQPK